MESAVKRIGVFTSGGDAPGMNAAIRSVVRTCMYYGIECIGIRRGYHGLINGDFVKMDFESVSGLSRRGGTMLYSARSEDFKAKEGQEKAAATCKLLGLDALVGIGGDGTFRGLLCLAQQGLSVIGIPALSTMTLPAPPTPSAMIQPATPPWSVLISSGIQWHLMSAARWWRSWAAMQGMLRSMWVLLAVPLQC